MDKRSLCDLRLLCDSRNRLCKCFIFLLLLMFLAGCISSTPSEAIEMHFEPKEGGFFIRPPSTPASMTSASSTSSSTSDELDLKELDSFADLSTVTTEHFTVLPSSQPVSIRVLYGPFSTKQSVPVRLLVPDPLDSPGGPNGTGGYSDPEMIPPLDLSAHIVTPTVPKDSPILRVLFHAGQTAFGLPITTQANSRGNRQQVCATFLCSTFLECFCSISIPQIETFDETRSIKNAYFILSVYLSIRYSLNLCFYVIKTNMFLLCLTHFRIPEEREDIERDFVLWLKRQNLREMWSQLVAVPMLVTPLASPSSHCPSTGGRRHISHELLQQPVLMHPQAVEIQGDILLPMLSLPTPPTQISS